MRLFFYTVLILIFPLSLFAAMTGGDFEIYGDSVSTIQGDYATGGAYSLTATGGEFFATSTTGGTLVLRGGFQALEKGTITLQTNTSTLSTGNLSQNAVTTSSVILTVTTESSSGYSVNATEDGNLRDGATGADIDDVADGTVTAGSEEYGISTNGTDGQLANDTALSGASTLVAQSNGPVASKQTTVLFNIAIDPTQTRAGTYSHIVTFSATANP